MKRASHSIEVCITCANCSLEYAEDILFACSRCKSDSCIRCAAGFDSTPTNRESRTMIEAYKSVRSNFICKLCQELMRLEQDAHTKDWGVSTFFSTRVPSDHKAQEASFFAYNNLTRTRFPNGSTAIMAAQDNKKHIVCAVGNYGGAWGPSAEVNIFA